MCQFKTVICVNNCVGMVDGYYHSFLKTILLSVLCVKKWNGSGFRPPLCTYRLNWARRTSWGWWNDWDDAVLQTQDSKFKPWRSEAEHATSRSRRFPTLLTFTRGWGRNFFCFFQTAETGNRTPNSGVKGRGANHYPRAPALLCEELRGKGKRVLPFLSCFNLVIRVILLGAVLCVKTARGR